MRIGSVLNHSAQAVAEGALIALLVVGLLAGTAFAGKPQTSGSTSGFRVADGVFAGTTTAQKGAGGASWVRARCSQDGSVVYEQWRSYASGTATLTLGPTPSWSSGSASCTAEEGYFTRNNRWRVLGTTGFFAAGG